MQVNYVIFDLGRTLIIPYRTPEEITEEGIHEVIKALKERGFHFEENKLFKELFEVRLKYIEKSLKELVQYTAEDAIREVLQKKGFNLKTSEYRDLVRRFFKPELENCYRPDPEAHEVLEFLKNQGKKLALLSNASDHEFVLEIVEKFGFKKYFERIFTSASIGFVKPHRKAFEPVLNYWQLSDPSQVAMIGDSLEMDIKGARALGMVAIWIKRDEIEPDHLPDFVIKELGELKNLNIW